MAQSILDVKGIGKVTSAILAKSGFKTANDLANTSVEKLAALPGFSETRAMQVIKNANDLITPVSKEKALTTLVPKAKEKAASLLITKVKKPAKDKKKKDKKDKSKSKEKDKNKGPSKKKDKKTKSNKKAKKSK
jgi:transcription termination factor NusA